MHGFYGAWNMVVLYFAVRLLPRVAATGALSGIKSSQVLTFRTLCSFEPPLYPPNASNASLMMTVAMTNLPTC